MNIYETVERLDWFLEYEGNSVYQIRPVFGRVCIQDIDTLVADGWEIVSATGWEVVVKKVVEKGR